MVPSDEDDNDSDEHFGAQEPAQVPPPVSQPGQPPHNIQPRHEKVSTTQPVQPPHDIQLGHKKVSNTQLLSSHLSPKLQPARSPQSNQLPMSMYQGESYANNMANLYLNERSFNSPFHISQVPGAALMDSNLFNNSWAASSDEAWSHLGMSFISLPYVLQVNCTSI